MRLAPGGYIMPHSDGEGRIFGPLNIAINNPEGCNFYFESWGKVPFKQGTGFFLDIGNVHAVYNNSDETRYHFIVHGDISKNLIQMSFNQLGEREKKICYGVYNQRNAINNFSMYLRAKGATLFYLNRVGGNLEIICGDEIHEILQESFNRGYEYCVVQSAGCTLKNFNFDQEIRQFIKENEFGVAGHPLYRPGEWLEVHNQFFIVNLLAWKEVGCPEFGDFYFEEQLFNSETMFIKNEGKFDLVVNTASGFKLFDIFKNEKLNEDGKIIVYDFNVKSLQWYKHFHNWRGNNLIDCIRSFSERDCFTWLGKNNHNYVEDYSFLTLYKKLMYHFGGSENFIKYWKIFKNTQVKFVAVDLYKESEKFANIFVRGGKKFVNLSNIFSTDATTFLYGHVEVQSSQQRCLSSVYVVDPEIEIFICDFWNRDLSGKVKDLI